MDGITVTGLCKAYGRAQILRDVTFSVPGGAVTGLLGPNGSGKTSILRMLTGLGVPDAGGSLFNGVPYVELDNPGRTVGVLLDASAHHAGRSVLETIRLAATLIGVERQRVAEIVEIMGLGSVTGRRFGALSLGMRQRVGLGIAVLGRPRFLILDEPVNGLDVESISWLRDVLLRFSRDEGGTVLISSHLLQELQTYVDHVVIVDRGTIAYAGPLDAAEAKQVCEVVSPAVDELREALDRVGIRWQHRDEPTRLYVHADARTVAQLALDHRILVTELVPGGERALEDLYLGLTDGEFSTGRVGALL